MLVPDSVYQPAEDSMMFADAASGLHGSVLEIGCGCGIASLSCAKNGKSQVLGTDINPDAVRCSKENAARNGIRNATFVQSDLFSNVERARFDAILFNPPYLPTTKEERVKGTLNHAFDGGRNGRKVLDRFLGELDGYLKPSGVLLMVQGTLNNPQETLSKLKAMGYEAGLAERRDFFFESIYLLKALKPPKP